MIVCGPVIAQELSIENKTDNCYVPFSSWRARDAGQLRAHGRADERRRQLHDRLTIATELRRRCRFIDADERLRRLFDRRTRARRAGLRPGRAAPAMMVLVIGILALFAMFESGIRTIKRASTVTTAGALADREMENFRAIRYDSIGLPDARHGRGFAVRVGSRLSGDGANRVALNACGTAPCTTKVPVQTLTGADGKSYRVDTYVTWQTVGAGRGVKLVTIVVRDGANMTKVWARTASSFDESTGSRRERRRRGVRARSGTCARELPQRRRRPGTRAALARPPAVVLRKLRHEIPWRDNVPVLSWVLLRGRCRHCSARIPWRYPAVELATAVLVAACLLVFGFTAYAALAAGFCAVLVAISAIDVEHRIVPNRIVVPATGAVLVAHTLIDPSVEWLLGGLAAVRVPLRRRGDLPGGHGDGRREARGAAGRDARTRRRCRAHGRDAPRDRAELSCCLARHGSRARKMGIPFAPFLAGGGIVALFAGGAAARRVPLAAVARGRRSSGVRRAADTSFEGFQPWRMTSRTSAPPSRARARTPRVSSRPCP